MNICHTLLNITVFLGLIQHRLRNGRGSGTGQLVTAQCWQDLGLRIGKTEVTASVIDLEKEVTALVRDLEILIQNFMIFNLPCISQGRGLHNNNLFDQINLIS